MQADLHKYYQVDNRDQLNLGPYQAFRYLMNLFFIVPVSIDEEEAQVIYDVGKYMESNGIVQVALVEKNTEGKLITNIDNQDIMLLKVHRKQHQPGENYGNILGSFHQMGKYYGGDIGGLGRIGTWKSLWENRIDVLENYWYKVLSEHPVERFDQCFIESFPYYMGLAENAIQYLVDTEIDEDTKLFDAGTFTWERFTRYSWGKDYSYKLPTEWVYDHPTRDLAEWIRFEYFLNEPNFEKNIFQFLNEYEKILPLSTFAWRLLYARLLFPVHYFSTVEDYYMSQDREEKYEHEEKLVLMLEDSKDYEEFLSTFFQSIRLPAQKLKIPKIDWL